MDKKYVGIDPARVLDVDRARFLAALDRVDPHLWATLRDAALPLLAIDRLRREAASQAGGWRPLDGKPLPALPPLSYDPRCLSLEPKRFCRRVPDTVTTLDKVTDHYQAQPARILEEAGAPGSGRPAEGRPPRPPRRSPKAHHRPLTSRLDLREAHLVDGPSPDGPG